MNIILKIKNIFKIKNSSKHNIENNHTQILGNCKRCNKLAKLNKKGLCEKCNDLRKVVLYIASPNNYGESDFNETYNNLIEWTKYDFKKLDIENAEIVEALNGVEKAFLLYCDAQSIYDFKIAMYWFFEQFIDCNYLISKFIKNGYLEIKYSTDLSKLTSEILKEALKQVNLKVSGTKSDLVKRIEENFTAEQKNELAKNQEEKFVITNKGLQEIGEFKPIIANDVDFENICYSLILENKLDIAYQMMCNYEKFKLVKRGLNCDWNNPPKKKFRINLYEELPFKLPSCLKQYEKDVKATAIYTNIMGSNPKNAVTFFCQRINTDIDRKILEKAFIFLCMYEGGALNLDYSEIENLENEYLQKSISLKNSNKLSIDRFIQELKLKVKSNGLNQDNLKYDVLKDGTYNFTYTDCQIGRIKIGKRTSKMQILTLNTVRWIENQSMDIYIKNIDEWIEYIKTLKNL